MTEEDKRNLQRYRAAMRSAPTSDPVRTCMVQIATLQALLVRKGVATESEWFEALADAAERDQPRAAAPLAKVVQEPIVIERLSTPRQQGVEGAATTRVR